MKIKVLAAGVAPGYYEINGDVITAYVGTESDSYDLSALEEGDTVTAVSEVGGIQPIRHATRQNGEIYVTLKQQVIASQYPGKRADWRGQQTINAGDYDPNTCYVTPTGMRGVTDYEVVWAANPLDGREGWTVRKVSEAN